MALSLFPKEYFRFLLQRRKATTSTTVTAMTAPSTANTAPTAAPADDPVLLPPGTTSNLSINRADHRRGVYIPGVRLLEQLVSQAGVVPVACEVRESVED